jgi:hypothetical protein
MDGVFFASAMRWKGFAGGSVDLDQGRGIEAG